MKALTSKLSEHLIFKNLKLVTVESCTGGWIGKTITDLAGSSDWYEGGFITYSNQAKNSLVGVPFELIEKHGAVSLEVAAAMVRGASQYFSDRVSVAVTGIAGPGGGSVDKPVGRVCIACEYHTELKTRKFNFSGNREEIRRQTVAEAFNLILSMDLNK